MAYLFVDQKKFSNLIEEIGIIKERVSSAQSKYSSISREIDWDIQAEENISNSLRRANSDLEEYVILLGKIKNYLNTAQDEYSKLDNKEQNSLINDNLAEFLENIEHIFDKTDPSHKEENNIFSLGDVFDFIPFFNILDQKSNAERLVYVNDLGELINTFLDKSESIFEGVLDSEVFTALSTSLNFTNGIEAFINNDADGVLKSIQGITGTIVTAATGVSGLGIVELGWNIGENFVEQFDNFTDGDITVEMLLAVFGTLLVEHFLKQDLKSVMI